MFKFCADTNPSLQTYGLLLFQEFPAKHEYTLSFVFGLILILFGFTLGYVSDRHLVRLRRTGRYLIPQGGMFDYVSCPHYLGELIEWFGFCIAANGSLATFSFAIWTCANLIPRALAQKDWYQQKFKSDYPPDRKAIFPGIL